MYCSKKTIIFSFISAEQTSVFESSALKFNSSPRKADVILNGALKLFSLYHLDFGLSRNYCNRQKYSNLRIFADLKKKKNDK